MSAKVVALLYWVLFTAGLVATWVTYNFGWMLAGTFLAAMLVWFCADED